MSTSPHTGCDKPDILSKEEGELHNNGEELTRVIEDIRRPRHSSKDAWCG